MKNTTFWSLENFLGVQECVLKCCDLDLIGNVSLNRGKSIESELENMFKDTIPDFKVHLATQIKG